MTENNSKEYIRLLVSQAQGGDAGTLESLKELYTPLLMAACTRNSSDSMRDEDREELFGEALIALFNAVMTYDLDVAGVEFGLYAKICIDNALISYRRAFERRSRLTSVSLDMLGEKREGEVDLIDVIVARESAADLARRISSVLSQYENKVWWLYVSGRSAKDIAAMLDADERSVHNAIYRIRRKLRGVIPPK